MSLICCALCTYAAGSTAREGEGDSTGRSDLLKLEADNNTATVHHHDDKTKPHLLVAYNKHFTQKRYSNAHRKRHIGQKFYSCTQCEKRFLCQTNLYAHMNIHTGKYKCSECGKCCRNNHDLAVHSRRHYSAEKLLKCTVCSKQFSTSRDLLTHSRIHSREILHKCSNQVSDLQQAASGVQSNRVPRHCFSCRKQFKTEWELKRHVRIHTGAKPYFCGQCPVSFTSHKQLQRHLLVAHNDGTWLILLDISNLRSYFQVSVLFITHLSCRRQSCATCCITRACCTQRLSLSVIHQ